MLQLRFADSFENIFVNLNEASCLWSMVLQYGEPQFSQEESVAAAGGGQPGGRIYISQLSARCRYYLQLPRCRYYLQLPTPFSPLLLPCQYTFLSTGPSAR